MNKKIINIIIWSGLLVLFFASLGFTGIKKKSINFAGFEIDIDYQNGSYFLEREDVFNDIIKKIGKPEGKKLQMLNLMQIENIVNSNPYIHKANAFATIDGKIKISVQQKVPLVRIFASNAQFYMDEAGTCFPLSKKFTARTLLAFVPKTFTNAELKKFNFAEENIKCDSNARDVLFDVFKVADYIYQQAFLKAMIDQMYVTNKNDIFLVTRVDGPIIEFGKADNIEEKFDNLKIFYKEGLSKLGWDKYDTVSIKFSNQVVCKK